MLSKADKMMCSEKASEVRERLQIKTPVEVEAVVESLGGCVEKDPCLDYYADGQAEPRPDGGFVIKVSARQPDTRRRFTIAHEIGHLLIHMGNWDQDGRWHSRDDIENVYFRDGRATYEEYQANEFAACLLMPEDEYITVAQEYTKQQIVHLKPIAEHFQVSVEAAANRGKMLGYLRW